MQREESGERRAGDDRAAQHQRDNRRPGDGHAAGDRGADPETPVGVLIEAHDLSGKRHAERRQQQEDADDPGQLARILVGAEQKDLRHVDEDDRDHEVRSPSVQRANEPAERDLMVQRLQAAPRLVGGWHVHHREENAGRELQAEDDQRGAAEDVPPAGRVARHRMFRGVADRRRQLQAVIDPFGNRGDHAHGGLSRSSAAFGPGVGSSPARIVTTPSSILIGYSKSPRSGGPEAREPSR